VSSVSSVVKSFRAVSAYRQRKKTAWIREEFNPFGVLASFGCRSSECSITDEPCPIPHSESLEGERQQWQAE
jgi:hypothetical protein